MGLSAAGGYVWAPTHAPSPPPVDAPDATAALTTAVPHLTVAIADKLIALWPYLLPFFMLAVGMEVLMWWIDYKKRLKVGIQQTLW